MTKGYSVKQCSKCGEIKPLDHYRYTEKKHKTRRSECNSCEKKYKNTDEYKEKEAAGMRRRRKENDNLRKRENIKVKEYGKTINGRAKRLYLAARYRARINNLEFSLFLAHIEVVLMIGVCQKTGIPFDYESPQKGKNFNPYAPSIDKKNPFLGYTPENIQIVCNAYNLAKNQFTDEQFLEFCKLVVNKNEK